MASKKKQATKAGAGAVAAGKAVKDNAYVQRVIEDEELRDNLRTAFESARKAYQRIASNGSPVKSLTEDRKTQKQLREAAGSLRDAADSLRSAKRPARRKRRGGLLLLIVGVGLAFALSEGLRKKALDTLFGAEEEFEYSSTTTPAGDGSAAEAPVGSTS